MFAHVCIFSARWGILSFLLICHKVPGIIVRGVIIQTVNVFTIDVYAKTCFVYHPVQEMTIGNVV